MRAIPAQIDRQNRIVQDLSKLIYELENRLRPVSGEPGLREASDNKSDCDKPAPNVAIMISASNSVLESFVKRVEVIIKNLHV